MERRELFKIIAAGAVATPVMGQEHVHAAVAPAVPHKAVFTPAQDAVLDRIADIIIPADEQSPGAHDAHVSRFLDLRRISQSAAIARVDKGVETIDAEAKSRFGKGFMECTGEQQLQLVELMAKNEGQPQTDLERFFTSLKPAVVDGYRYSEVGVKQFMRWEGNQYDVSAWKGACNHREHQS